MQQWEDWRAGYDWRVLLEKVLLTLLVVALSSLTWRAWTTSQGEAAVSYTVEIPAQLSTPAAQDETKRSGPSEEVSIFHVNLADSAADMRTTDSE